MASPKEDHHRSPLSAVDPLVRSALRRGENIGQVEMKTLAEVCFAHLRPFHLPPCIMHPDPKSDPDFVRPRCIIWVPKCGLSNHSASKTNPPLVSSSRAGSRSGHQTTTWSERTCRSAHSWISLTRSSHTRMDPVRCRCQHRWSARVKERVTVDVAAREVVIDQPSTCPWCTVCMLNDVRKTQEAGSFHRCVSASGAPVTIPVGRRV